MSARIVDALCKRVSVGLAVAALAAVPRIVNGQVDDSQMLTYSRGQPVMPLYEGWHPNSDGTIDLWFGYLNKNWREETDIPVGPNNSVTGPFVPNTADAGQPTHFLPRNNRWQFAVRIPNAQALAKEEVVWTVTSHGTTYKAYATLKSQYVRDDEGIQREFFFEVPEGGNEAPKISIQGDLTPTIKVGQPYELAIIATDDGKPIVRRRRGAAGAAGVSSDAPFEDERSICGTKPNQFFCGAPNEDGGQLFEIRGFRVSCFLYRGDPTIKVSSRQDFGQASLLVFDPPQAKVWEDPRGGSPFAAGYVLPLVPKDNTWRINATFMTPGTYVVRCQAHDGLLATNQDVTFNVLE
jgi:hypothetical protein